VLWKGGIVANALTYHQSVVTWIARELGVKQRRIEARFDVDPRRLFEVWRGEIHPASRDHAIRLFRVIFPGRIPKYGFEFHIERYRRVNRDQLDLFGGAV
jgi:hypothetical protein